MRQGIPALLIVAAVLFASGRATVAQVQHDPSDVFTVKRGSINLFGDIKIENAEPAKLQPQSLQLMLVTTGGTMVSRQPVSNNSRYRFLNLPVGEYNLVVELDNVEVARIYVQLTEANRGDVRRDIVMEWRESLAAGGKKVISAPQYERPSANESLFKKAEAATEQGNYGEAIAAFEQLVDSDPKDFESWNALGTAHFLQKNNAGAEKAYLRALKERPSMIVAQLNLARLHSSERNYDAAIKIVTEAVKSQPKSADAHYLLGELYLQIKKGSLAVNHLNEAIRIDPTGKADAHLRLAALYNAAGLKERAAAEYEQFLQKRPAHADRRKFESYIKQNKKP